MERERDALNEKERKKERNEVRRLEHGCCFGKGTVFPLKLYDEKEVNNTGVWQRMKYMYRRKESKDGWKRKKN